MVLIRRMGCPVGCISRSVDRGRNRTPILPPAPQACSTATRFARSPQRGLCVPAPIDVRLERVTKRFHDVIAVDDLSLDVMRGEFFSLLGPSGCGKTTTLRMIGGFEEATAGT